MRTKIGIWKMPIAVIEVTMPGPATAASMIAESSAGNAKVKSESRMISFLDPSPAGGRNQPERGAERQTDAHRDDADHDRASGAYQQQRDDVAAQHVGAEPVQRGRRIELVRHVDLVGRPWRPDQRQQRRRHHQHGEHAARHEAAVSEAHAARSSGRTGAAATEPQRRAERRSTASPHRSNAAHDSLALRRGSIAA